MKAPRIIADRESCLTDLTVSSGTPPSPAPLEGILDSLDEGVVLLDRNGLILRTNPAFRRLFPRSGVGVDARSVVPGATFHEMLDDFLRDFLPESHASPAFRITLEGDVVLSARIIPLAAASAENDPRAVAVFHDVSDLAHLNLRRREFMGEIAHELRTPLTAVIGFAETILDLPPRHTEDRQKFTRSILRNARHMALLVEDMLRLSRLESGSVPMQPDCVRASFVLDDALDACSPLLEKCGLEVSDRVNKNMNIHADERYIVQVFRNLLENACRYAPAGSTVTVTGEPCPQTGKAVFSVCDEGPGIPQEDVERIFDRFYRVEKTRPSPSSTGLGLAICRQIVERHGGSIRAEKGPGGKFVFTIPLALRTG